VFFVWDNLFLISPAFPVILDPPVELSFSNQIGFEQDFWALRTPGKSTISSVLSTTALVAARQCLTPIILATQEAEIRRITVCTQKKGAGGVAQGVGPEFKPQFHTKKRTALV
jgi:hypothetical protein